jgi:pimeloyl-ACP methyl ester carboxylesterase
MGEGNIFKYKWRNKVSILKGKLLNIISIIVGLTVLSNTFAATLYTSKNKFISYTDVGLGRPLVLIHAFPTDLRLWDPQQISLQKHFRVISLDLWGFGQSSPVNGQAVTMTDYADEVSSLLEQLQIQKAIIGGESMGGYVALAFLEKYPDKVEGLVLSDTQSIADNEETKTKRETTAIEILQNGTANFISNFLPKALSPNASERTKLFLQNILESEAATAIASASRGMALRKDTSHVLAHSMLPILIITGDQDVLINPEQSRNMHLLAKNSQLIILKNAGHLSSLEQFEQWNEAVINIFSTTLNS